MASKRSKVSYAHAEKSLFGLMIFLLGLVKYLGYSWEIALMVVGVLMALKGLNYK